MKKSVLSIKILLLLAMAMLFTACPPPPIPPCEDLGNCEEEPEPIPAGGVRYAGIRSCYYGFGGGSGKGFPTPQEAANVIRNIAAKFEGATPSAVWIIGGIQTPQLGNTATCRLEFAEPENWRDHPNYDPYITFAGDYLELSWGEPRQYSHEDYLNKFDEIGAKVFLQIEAGGAEMENLIALCLEKYGRHSSVIGFGFDVEWYTATEGVTNGQNIPDVPVCEGSCDKNRDGEVDDDAVILGYRKSDETPLNPDKLQYLTDLVKEHGKELKVMSKHWDKEYVGGTSKKINDVIYFSSSQGVGSSLESQFADWADSFYPNESGFQIGYNNSTDVSWWRSYEDPIKDITNVIIQKMKTENAINIYWTDFTIRWEDFDDLWNDPK